MPFLGETPQVYVPPPRGAAVPGQPGSKLWDGDGFGFSDVLDVVNPLQHIPVISSLYRQLTGDDIGSAPRVLGGALFGGAIGFVASLIDAVVADQTGKDLGEHAMAALFGDDEATPGDGESLALLASAQAFSSVNDAVFETAGSAPAAAAAPAPEPTAPVGTELAEAGPVNDAVFTATSPAAAPASPGPGSKSVPPTPGAAATSAAITAPGPAWIDHLPTGLPADAAGNRAPSETTSPPSPPDHDQAVLARFAAPGDRPKTPPGPWFGRAMMYGLDRYEAMARARSRPTPTLDDTF